MFEVWGFDAWNERLLIGTYKRKTYAEKVAKEWKEMKNDPVFGETTIKERNE